MKCEVCGKRAQFGHNVSHSKRHTLRRWLPNVHRTTIMVEGRKRKVNICTRCLRTQYKPARPPKPHHEIAEPAPSVSEESRSSQRQIEA